MLSGLSQICAYPVPCDKESLFGFICHLDQFREFIPSVSHNDSVSPYSMLDCNIYLFLCLVNASTMR